MDYNVSYKDKALLYTNLKIYIFLSNNYMTAL